MRSSTIRRSPPSSRSKRTRRFVDWRHRSAGRTRRRKRSWTRSWRAPRRRRVDGQLSSRPSCCFGRRRRRGSVPAIRGDPARCLPSSSVGSTWGTDRWGPLAWFRDPLDGRPRRWNTAHDRTPAGSSTRAVMGSATMGNRTAAGLWPAAAGAVREAPGEAGCPTVGQARTYRSAGAFLTNAVLSRMASRP
jgi:hypothetical protein